MSYTQKPIAARLDAAGLALYGARSNDRIKALLAARSYDEAALDAGLALYETARLRSRQVHVERGEQYAATDAVQAMLQGLQAGYAEDLRLARVEFEDERGSAEQLGLGGRRPRALAAWIAQVRRFYEAVETDPELAARLEALGLTETVLQARKAALEALEAARHEQAGARGEAKALTRQRRAAMQALDAWMRRFLQVAQVALAEHPEGLEKLGLRS